MSLPHGAGVPGLFFTPSWHPPFRTDPMSDEREFVTFFDLVRWALPTALVLLGVIFFFLHPDAAPAMAAAISIP